VGLRCSIYTKRRDTAGNSESDCWVLTDNIFPEDVNRRQTFTLPRAENASYDQLKLVFEQSSDFFGRIVMYDLSLDGDIVGAENA
jgi:hypothetical protein